MHQANALKTKEILVVEDNPSIQKLLKDSLSKYPQFNIKISPNLLNARSIIKNNHLDLIILDLILPDGSGYDLCKYIRQNSNFSNIKIIILTQKSDIETRVSSFRTGADDYLPKPFYPQELIERINRLVGLSQHQSNENLIKYQNFTLDTNFKKLMFNDSQVLLTHTEALVIQYLFTQNPKPQKQQLITYLNTKQIRSTNESALAVLMQRLRTKLEKTIGMKLIKTKYGYGYYLGV